MRAVVCPDKFRGSLTAAQAASCIEIGLRRAGVADVTARPMADGGEGTLDALLAARGGRPHAADVVDALGAPVTARWATLPDEVAVVEAATSIGLGLLGARRDPVGASSRGLGLVIAQALATRPRRLVIAVGGVATTDGGLGCLDALGWDLQGVPTVVACDVTTRFVAAATEFGPQKGASAADVAALSSRLRELAARFAATGRDIADLPGSGAAGGLAGGLAAIGALLAPGFDVVAQAAGLPELVAAADLVVTGEGRLDRTSLQGKVVGGVLGLPRPPGARTAVLAGAADPATADELRGRGVHVATVRELAVDEADSMLRANQLLEQAAHDTPGRAFEAGEPG